MLEEAAVISLLKNCTDDHVGAALLSGLRDLSRVVDLKFAVTPALARHARKSGLNLTLSVASSQSPAETLDVLKTDPRLSVRRVLAKNPNLSPAAAEYLFRWGHRKDRATVRSVLANPALLPQDIVRVIEDEKETPEGFEYCGLHVLRNLARSEEHLLWALGGSEGRVETLGYISSYELVHSLSMERMQGPHLLDVLAGGSLAKNLDADYVDRLTRCAIREISRGGSFRVDERTLAYVLDLGSPDAGFHCQNMTVEAAKLAWDYPVSDGGITAKDRAQLRHLVLVSKSCPAEAIQEVLNDPEPDGFEASTLIQGLFVSPIYSELNENLISLAERVPNSASSNRIADTIDRTLVAGVRRRGPLGLHYTSAFALRVMRLATSYSFGSLIELLNESDLGELSRDPRGALSDNGPHGIRNISHSRILRAVVSLADHPGMSEFMSGLRGVVPELFTENREDHWATAMMVQMASERFGGDAEAWRTMRTLGPTWEGTVVELVDVISKMCGCETEAEVAEDAGVKPSASTLRLAI